MTTFAPGSRARVKLSGASLSAGAVNPQPPRIGVVQAGTPPNAPTDVIPVMMENGTLISVQAQFLDEILPTNPTLAKQFVDKVVNGWQVVPTTTAAGVPYTDDYIGRVVDVYDINSPGSTRVLIRSLSNGMYYELPYSSVDNNYGDR
jgi:hypothetical protein